MGSDIMRKRKRKSRVYQAGELVGGLRVLWAPKQGVDATSNVRDQRYLVQCLNCGAERYVGRVTLNQRARVPVQHCKKCMPRDLTKKEATPAPPDEQSQIYVKGWGTKLGPMGFRYG